MAIGTPQIEGWFGVAASSHWLASQTAMHILEIGGNAFDAAVAGGLVLQAAMPHLNGPAGDLALLYHDARRRETGSIGGQGPLPRAATPARFDSLGLASVPGTGLLPAVVPGAFDAWMLLLLEKGSLPLRAVLDPAITYAQSGVPVGERLRAVLAAAHPVFERYWPGSLAVFLPGGRVPAVGDLFTNPALAATWRQLLYEAERAGGSRSRQIDAARTAWSDGFVADAIDDFCAHTRVVDVTGRAHCALLTGADLAGWRAGFEPTADLVYGRRRIVKCGPWSQGPVLLQTLSLLPPDEIAALDPVGAAFVHRVTEAMKLAYADREAYYGDPDRIDVPLDRLLSPDYASGRRGLIGETASVDWRPGRPAGAAAPWSPDYAAAVARQAGDGLLDAYGGGLPAVEDLDTASRLPFDDLAYRVAVSGDTCHLAISDRDGNVVSATPSGGWLQSSPAIPDLGFPLGTRGQMAWLDPRAPSRLAPRHRPRTTLSPTLVLTEDGGCRMACGTPGGDQQDQWQSAFLLRHLVHGMSLRTAAEAPNFRCNHWPSSFHPRAAQPGRLVVEGRFGAVVCDDLRARGHDLLVGDDWGQGRLNAIARDPQGRLFATTSRRDDTGCAVGR